MNTNIRNAEARRFWEAAFLQTLCKEPIQADWALDAWAARFGTEDDLSDIEANKARRAMGNEP